MATEYEDQVEQSLVRAIGDAPTDPAPRLLYADFLEEQFDPRAEYIRLSCQLVSLPANDSLRDVIQMRLSELASGIPSHWRAEVADGYPEHCPACTSDPQRGFKHCPQPWLSLMPTDDSERRVCHACVHQVVYCGSLSEVTIAIAAKRPVVLDPAIVRNSGDVPELPFNARVAKVAMDHARQGIEEYRFVEPLEEKANQGAKPPSLLSWIKSWFSTDPE